MLEPDKIGLIGYLNLSSIAFEDEEAVFRLRDPTFCGSLGEGTISIEFSLSDDSKNKVASFLLSFSSIGKQV